MSSFDMPQVLTSFIAISFQIPFLQCGIRVYKIISIDINRRFELVSLEIFWVVHTEDCWVDKCLNLLIYLSKDKKMEKYSLDTTDDWQQLI